MTHQKNVLLIGSGGREHAIAQALIKSPNLSKLYIAPGNPGTAQCGENLAISDTDIPALLDAAKERNVDLVFVGPEAPLAAGIVDVFKENGIAIVGPNQEAAQLESSKQWSKALMNRAGIPTAAFEVFEDYDSAADYVKTAQYPIVIKADGLAAGKGVTIAETEAQALQALSESLVDKRFKDAGNTVVIESFLVGEEASIFAFCDGKTILPMVAAQDHKALLDQDKGPNTGGMGAYSPAPLVTDDVYQKVMDQVFLPLLAQFQKEGILYQGIVYAGLMINEDGEPSIVEFNARFGDPETQVVLPRLNTDLLEIFEAMANQTLSEITLSWSDEAVVSVVMAAKGYPLAYPKGMPIKGLDRIENKENIQVFHAGTKEIDGQYLSNGGRVLNVVGRAGNLADAIRMAYDGVQDLHFDDSYFRTDIGQKGLAALERVGA